MVSNVITKSREVTLLGNTNVDYLKKNDNLAIKNISHLYGFQQIVTKPSRITKYSKTLIDTIIVTRNNIVWKLARGYCLCYCKTFSLVPDSTECTKIFVTEKCSTLLVSPKIKYYYSSKENHQ